MGKNAISYFNKLMVAMAGIGAAIAASEDGKITGAEMIGIVTVVLQGLGMQGVDLKGIALTPAPDGGVNLYFPPKVVEKFHINV